MSWWTAIAGTVTAWLLAVGALAGCSSPELDGQRWSCQDKADCGAGFQCDTTAGFCVPALSDRHGVTGSSITLGMSAATGTDVVQGAAGRAIQHGLRAAFHHVNKTGGVHRRSLQLVVKDDGHDATRTRSNVAQMVQGDNRQVFALVGIPGAAPALAAKQLAVKNRTVLFAPHTGIDSLEPDPPAPFVFNVRARYSDEARQLTRHLLERAKPGLAAGNIAVFAQGDDSGSLDELGQSSLAGVASALGKQGIKKSQIRVTSYAATQPTKVDTAVVELLRWISSGKRDVSSSGTIRVAVVLLALQDAAAALIKDLQYHVGRVRTGWPLPSEFGTFTKFELDRLRVAEVRFVVLSAAGAGLADALEARGTYTTSDSQGKHVERSYGAGTVMALPVPHHGADLDGVKTFRTRLTDYDPSLKPSFDSLEGYLDGMLLAEALRRHGPDLTSDSFVETLERLAVDLGTGTTYRFTGNCHQATDRLWGVRIDATFELQPLGLLPR